MCGFRTGEVFNSISNATLIHLVWSFVLEDQKATEFFFSEKMSNLHHNSDFSTYDDPDLNTS